jgi:outer membrane biosynthesis protein TonB
LLSLFNRVSLSAAIVAVSVLAHLGFVGAIVFAERRHLPTSGLQAMDVDLVPPEELEPKKEEPPKPPEAPKPPERLKPPEPPKQAELKPPEPVKQSLPPPAQSLPPKPRAGAAGPKSDAGPEPDQAAPPPESKQAAKPPAKPDIPQGGPAGEGKSKLTPEEIAALRAQIQKCWKLPVGIPGIMGLEVILRVSFGPKGQLAGQPVLLQAPASERGPMLVGIAMNALQGCYPYTLPPAKYADWKTLDLKFTATGMVGLGVVPKLPKRS